jgi:hypothetical protein
LQDIVRVKFARETEPVEAMADDPQEYGAVNRSELLRGRSVPLPEMIATFSA